MKYKQFSIEEREKIQELMWQNISVRGMARMLGRSHRVLCLLRLGSPSGELALGLLDTLALRWIFHQTYSKTSTLETSHIMCGVLLCKI